MIHLASLHGDSDDKDDEADFCISTNQFAKQALQEMDTGFLQSIHERLYADSTDPVEFWVTKDARDRCLRIVEKIGGPKEKQRANALFWGMGMGDYLRCRSIKTMSMYRQPAERSQLMEERLALES